MPKGFIYLNAIRLRPQFRYAVGNWTGVGYLIIDPTTGVGAYQISGGANGSILVVTLVGLAAICILAATGMFVATTLWYAPLFGLLYLLTGINLMAHIHFLIHEGLSEVQWSQMSSSIFAIAAMLIAPYGAIYQSLSSVLYTLGTILGVLGTVEF